MVVNGAQPIHMAFTKQIAPLTNLFNQLFKRDFLPLPVTALANALQAVVDTERVSDLAHHGIAAGAGGRAVNLPLFAVGADAAKRIGHWGAHR